MDGKFSEYKKRLNENTEGAQYLAMCRTKVEEFNAFLSYKDDKGLKPAKLLISAETGQASALLLPCNAEVVSVYNDAAKKAELSPGWLNEREYFLSLGSKPTEEQLRQFVDKASVALDKTMSGELDPEEGNMGGPPAA